jgi:hypothetical protein
MGRSYIATKEAKSGYSDKDEYTEKIEESPNFGQLKILLRENGYSMTKILKHEMTILNPFSSESHSDVFVIDSGILLVLIFIPDGETFIYLRHFFVGSNMNIMSSHMAEFLNLETVGQCGVQLGDNRYKM